MISASPLDRKDAEKRAQYCRAIYVPESTVGRRGRRPPLLFLTDERTLRSPLTRRTHTQQIQEHTPHIGSKSTCSRCTVAARPLPIFPATYRTQTSSLYILIIAPKCAEFSARRVQYGPHCSLPMVSPFETVTVDRITAPFSLCSPDGAAGRV
jgi:hypothetical protein